jgi:hypothetical protein
MKNFKAKTFALAALIIALFGATAACGVGEEYATSTSDTHVCVFDGSERGGQRLKFQIAPGAESRKIDDNDQVVRIPASNRFWMVTADRTLADPGAPDYYLGNDTNGVRIQIEGQIRFKFNLDRACEWYSLHGRRNADGDGNLGFNTRGADAAQAGWFRFGNENFVVTMQEVVSELGGRFDAEALHYNTVDETGTPTRQRLGEVLSEAYSDRLAQNLGGEFFCGTAEPTEDDPCPDMTFQVRYAGPGHDSALVQEREAEERTRRALEREAAEAELEAAQHEQRIVAEQREQALLTEQAETAALEAQINFAPCAPYAAAGLDCEGHHPTVVYPGSTG